MSSSAESESSIQAAILRATCGERIRLWRSNVAAAAVTLPEVRRALIAEGIPKTVVDRIARRLRPRDVGIPGQSDLTGILGDGRFVGVEVKSATGRLSERQVAFKEMVERFNGVYLVARSVDDFMGILR